LICESIGVGVEVGGAPEIETRGELMCRGPIIDAESSAEVSNRLFEGTSHSIFKLHLWDKSVNIYKRRRQGHFQNSMLVYAT